MPLFKTQKSDVITDCLTHKPYQKSSPLQVLPSSDARVTLMPSYTITAVPEKVRNKRSIQAPVDTHQRVLAQKPAMHVNSSRRAWLFEQDMRDREYSLLSGEVLSKPS